MKFQEWIAFFDKIFLIPMVTRLATVNRSHSCHKTLGVVDPVKISSHSLEPVNGSTHIAASPYWELLCLCVKLQKTKLDMSTDSEH